MGKKIDAEELYHRMYEEAFEKDSDLQRWDSGCWIRFKLFENVLKDMPEIEVNQKTGHWTRSKKQFTVGEYLYKCSECGTTWEFGWNYKYCPNCGAKMEGE